MEIKQYDQTELKERMQRLLDLLDARKPSAILPGIIFCARSTTSQARVWMGSGVLAFRSSSRAAGPCDNSDQDSKVECAAWH